MAAIHTLQLRVAVIGAGPAGFYATEALLKNHETVEIDLLERLPTPYGLVRYGVAPDHPKIKSVTRIYDRTANDPRVRFLGNVEYGKDLDHVDLERHYDAAVFAVGSPADRRLGIEGEDLQGSLSATEFVAWYNGHPVLTIFSCEPSQGNLTWRRKVVYRCASRRVVRYFRIESDTAQIHLRII